MRTPFLRLKQAALALLLAFTAPAALRAQLDPRLQGGTSSSDLLDVYKSGGAKPELLTVFDNSGSMGGVYWDSRYYADVNQSWHNNTWFDTTGAAGSVNKYTGDAWGLVPVARKTGSGASTMVYVDFVRGYGYYQFIQSSTKALSNGVLVRPDGSLLTYADVGSTNIRDWVQKASHVRITASYKVGASVVNRTVDLPLPWAVFDRSGATLGALTESSSSGTDKTVAGQPRLLRVWDPVPSKPSAAQFYIVDTLYQSASKDYILNAADSNYGLQKIGLFHYNYDYLWWIFYGKDERVFDGTGTLQSGNAKPYSGSNAGGYTVPSVSDGGTAWKNGLPGITRIQALKQATLTAYVENQDQVYWCTRFFAPCGSSQAEEGKTTYNSNNQNGAFGDRKLLRLLPPSTSSNPDVSIRNIQDILPSTSTPLTYALMNALAQMASPAPGVAGSEFNENKTENPIPACRQSYVAIFTDGIANDQYSCSNGDFDAVGTDDVYASGATAGNAALAGRVGDLKPQGKLFNVWTYAALAAHYPTTSSKTGAPTDADSSGVKIPFAITTRGATAASPRRIRVMSVGMSLAGKISDVNGGKTALYRAALYGYEKNRTWSLADPPAPYDPTNPSANDRVKNPFFFDATDPARLVDAMRTILGEVKLASSTLSAPTTPLAGLSIGKQVYLGTFTTDEGPVWRGDLLMSGLVAKADKVSFLDKNGVETATLNGDTAEWSAADALDLKGWQNRAIWTTLPGAKGVGANQDFKESNSSLTNAALGLPGGATAAQRNKLIRYVRGASTDAQNDAASPTSKKSNRSDMMGDIINSTPAILEWDKAFLPASGPLADFKATSGIADKDLRFRLIFVGTNQGVMHAFGELSGFTSDGKLKGAVDELWAYIPSEVTPFLANITSATAGHRYIVDGAPAVYFDDKPTVSRPSGDGRVNGSDVVRVVFGLGKGGRGTYAIGFDGNDPQKPYLAWSQLPDEGASPDKTKAENLVGYSTSRPVFSRFLDGSNVIRDAVILGGGLSTPLIEAKPEWTGKYGAGVKFGRSILAVDAVDGGILKSWNFLTDFGGKYAAMGPVASGAAPMEVLTGSGMTQRLYFGDMFGGVFALGTKAASGKVFRQDSSRITDWDIRKIYQASAGTTLSAVPQPFTVPNGARFPRTTDPKIVPAAVALVFGTGDRNDPMDFDAVNPPGGAAGRNRFVFLLDRQDSASVSHDAFSAKDVDSAGMTDADLADLSGVVNSAASSIDPSNDDFWMKKKLGYFLNYPAGIAKAGPSKGGSNWFYAKTVSNATVLNGVLFFSVFQPSDTAGQCGGSGTTFTYRMCSALAPVFNNGSTAAADTAFTGTNDASNKCSGVVMTFTNIGGDATPLGTTGIIQAGQVLSTPGGDTDPGTSDGTVRVLGALGHPSSLGQRPRSWRVVR
jgi:hypothetical protein